MTTKLFGPRKWGMPDAERCPIPVGWDCLYCPRKIGPLDYGVVMPYSSVNEDKEVAVHQTCLMNATGVWPNRDAVKPPYAPVVPELVKGDRVEMVDGPYSRGQWVSKTEPTLHGLRGTVHQAPDKSHPTTHFLCWIIPDNPDAFGLKTTDDLKAVCVETHWIRKLNVLELLAEAAQ